ncbi:MAG: hypothetical protein J7K64_05990 [Bacteroidales bacterium]|nr:hypothetical protein [Bacteroidales bacterium]
MKSTFKIFEANKLITEILSSDITTDEYIKLKHDEFHHAKFNRKFNLITDFRLCENNFDDADLQEMINIFTENKGKISRKKSAFIISETSRLKRINLNKNISGSPQEIKYFTNPEDAQKWAVK